MKHSASSTHDPAACSGAWWSRMGVTGFLFFLAKGLLWLFAPALLAWIHGPM